MIEKNKTYLLLLLFLSITLGICSINNIWAAEKSKPIRIKILQPEEWPIVTTLGRLVLERRGEKEWLVLQAKDAKTYLIKGGLVEKLKSLLRDLGKDNLVAVTGKQDNSYNLSCRNIYKFDSRGNKIIDTQCIRYYHLEVTQILEAKKSEEVMPPPKRDVEEERRTKMSALSHLHQRSLMQTQIREIRGKINSLNLKSPIKTVEVSYRDKDNQVIDKVLLLTSNTRVAKKKLDNEKPMYVSVNSLKADQEVAVIYARDERKAEALFITITKE